MPGPSPSPDRLAPAARYVLTHAWEVFVVGWNWKAATLSTLFRGAALALPLTRGANTTRALCVELGFRVAVGGFWGSLLEVFRGVRPAWLAGLSVAVALPAAAQCLEFAALHAWHATHIRTAMIVSTVVSVGSLLVNLGLMRRGLLITGGGAESLRSDLERIPGALTAMWRGLFGRCPT